MLLSFFQKVAAWFIQKVSSLIAPVECVVCQRSWSYVCLGHRKLLLKHPNLCCLCHGFSHDRSICPTHTSSLLKGIIVWFYYTRLVQDCIYQSKYGDSYHLLSFFASQLLYDIQIHPALSYALSQWTLVISYIPMHWRKEHHMRWYNQAQKLAMYISTELKIPCINICSKQEYTRTQTTFSREKRMKNQENVFVYNSESWLETNQTVLVVDDVLTTWSTLLSFAAALKDAGVDCSLRWLCVARHG